MDDITVLIVIAVVFLFGVGLYLKLTINVRKGKAGERKVAKVLQNSVTGHGYVINDLILVGENGNSTQIDHILIDERGVFLIETKNYSGKIFGKDDWQEWTQILANGKTKNKFHNPVKQNNTHLYYLKSLLPHIYVSPLVVFVQNNTEHIESKQVIPLSRLKHALHETPSKPLTAEQVEEVHDTILSAAATKFSKKKHIKNISKMLDNIEANRCPRCNGKLVERKGQYGIFYGCENYPRCKFTKKQ